MGVVLRCKLVTQRINVKIVMCQFVPNFLGYVSAKYYLNLFTIGKVITEIRRVNLCYGDTVYILKKCHGELVILLDEESRPVKL